jgi:endonuclease/exonuclease/phosphatase (EEP) superfamily protein YafD
MTSLRALSTAILLAMGVQPQSTWAEWRLPLEGSYEITARLELPHLERWAVDKTTIVCLPSSRRGAELPIPVVSANNPFEKCTAANLAADSQRLEYDIVCPGRGAAKAHATYTLSADTFSGRVAMVMGGKNMTMAEVQQARRIGKCGPAVMGSTARF